MPSYPGHDELRKRYPEVAEFSVIMLEELWDNRGKGDQDGWRSAEPKDLAYDVSWHLIKLMAALKADDAAGVTEHAADVANMALMVWDSYRRREAHGGCPECGGGPSVRYRVKLSVANTPADAEGVRAEQWIDCQNPIHDLSVPVGITAKSPKL